MNRKTFIVAATGGLLAVGLPTWYFKFRPLQYDKSLAVPAELTIIMDAPEIRSLGSAYLKAHPDENSERELVGLLDQGSQPMNERVARDYKAGEIAMVDGWLLSTTEARQCALFTTIHSK